MLRSGSSRARRHKPLVAVPLAALVLGSLLALGQLPGQVGRAAAATTNNMKLQVVSARNVGTGPGYVHKGDVVPKYHFIINNDDTGNPAPTNNCLPPTNGAAGSPTFPANCQWPSIRETPGAVGIVTQGDETNLNAATSLNNLPAGRYLISVTADGYSIGGAHFTMPLNDPGLVAVELQPFPIPLGSLRLRVFNDSVPTDATYEAGTEVGLAGFHAHLADVLGEVTTDYFGNPLCTAYVHSAPDATHPGGVMVFDANNKPIIAAGSIGQCISDAGGDIVIPNMGSNRYGATVIPPAGSPTTWVQTTTLEGSHDFDVWTQQNDTGLDTEMTIGGEKIPFVDFGFTAVTPLPAPAGPVGGIKGTIVLAKSYWPPVGGVPNPGTGTGVGYAGNRIAGPIDRPYIALSDLNNGDQMIYMGRGNPDGTFNIPNVPPSSYTVSAWDGPQDVILDTFQATVVAGQVTDVGTNLLTGWFTNIDGTVFVDTNGNGKRDPGEQGIPNIAVALKSRDNSLMDQGSALVSTDNQGHYSLKEGYPLGKWIVQEVFDTRYMTTGVTYQADNQPTETTLLGAAVDLNVHMIIGLGGRVDWGVKPYDSHTNGGIVGTVTYDTTRNELDAKFSVTEDYQPGIPGLPVHLYASVPDPATGIPLKNPDGSLQKGPELADTYTSETWSRPKGCTARDVNGVPLQNNLALPANNDPTKSCVESPMLGFQAGADIAPDGTFGVTVNGNYGFGTSKLNQYAPGDPNNPTGVLPLYADLATAGLPDQALKADDYIVQVEIPNDSFGRPLYNVTREEDVNIFRGDGWLPQENFPPPANLNPPDPPTPTTNGAGGPISGGAGFIADCAGANHLVHVTDQPFIDGGGSPFEGQQKPLCDAKLVTVRNGQSTAPNFNLFTEVPLPTHFWGLTINDLMLSHDPKSVLFGENAGVPNAPVGLYDFAGRLVDTVNTDPNGYYEALEPSTSTYNCPLPAGPCPGMYRFVANDPGQPGHINANYSPRYRTIAANFQAWPGLYTPTDEAPTQVGAVTLSPTSSQVNPVNCDLSKTSTASPPTTTPQIFSVSRPYVRTTDSTALRTLTVKGVGFGATAGQLTLDGAVVPTTAGGWSDTSVTFVMPTTTTAPRVLSIKRAASLNGLSTVNGLTVHVLGGTYNPRLFQVNRPSTAPPLVGTDQNFTTIQAALEAAARTATGSQNSPPNTLVVVWPGASTVDNPLGSYYENLIMHSPVKLQGVGPGGFDTFGAFTAGSVISGLAWNVDNQIGTDWYNLLTSLNWAGSQDVPDGEVIAVLARSTNAFGTAYKAAIDGFTISGGEQKDFANNLNVITGHPIPVLGPVPAGTSQGGGIFVNAYAHELQINDNVIMNNGGSYGGAIRVGTPYIAAPNTDNHNDNLKIQRNRIRDNGGTNLGGAVALFNGTANYEISNNDLCGNFSAEYGGGISHFGSSPGGNIHDNRIYFNQSYDEGAGIMIAGELPTNPNQLSKGSGAVSIHENLIQYNLANDDGGGIRLLQAGNFQINIFNNTIANNVSTHEGGGIALDDAPNVRFYNNTVMKNITTATAVTSDGKPAPAGLSTGRNSTQLQATLPAGSPVFSRPTLFNNIFWDNRAGSWDGVNLVGVGPTGTNNYWDIGAGDGSGPLLPTFSVLQPTTANHPGQVTPAASNRNTDPRVIDARDTTVGILPFRTNPNFVQALIVTNSLPPELQGNYHLQGTAASSPSPARNAGTTSGAPTIDIDHERRPNCTLVVGICLSPSPVDMGSDELQ